ncbi:MAG: DUF692 domain-containing protein [Rhodococcus sp.]|nr:DUF692 domain-containing protein [Rhodococcus sp. (in: high G+C Gram-positive bacteria)]
MYDDLPTLGVGLGYRLPLHRQTLDNRDRIDFVEFIADQYLYGTPERTERFLQLREHWPLVPHGVGMSIGSATEVDRDYLDRLGTLVEQADAPWFSDHLSFTKVPDTDVEQLTPLWFTEESFDTVCRNVEQVKNTIDKPFLLENITYYFHLPGNDMSEAEFTTRVLEETDTGLLLDVNNVWVNSVNLGFDPYEFLDSIPLERTVQIHLAGGEYVEDMMVDTHGAPVHEPVWKLLDYVLERVQPKAILLEWDQSWPDFEELLAHLDRARAAVAASQAKVS